MSDPLFILGAGGHAKVVADTLLEAGAEIQAFVDQNSDTSVGPIFGIAVIGDERAVLDLEPGEIRLCNGVGFVGADTRRRDVYDLFAGKGYVFEQAVHPSAIIGRDVTVGDGVQIFAGAVVQSGASVGANTIINTRASVDHDCVIGSHAHIAPGAVLGGGVTVGDGTHIGAGATIIQNIKIGAGALVAAGATVVSNVEPGRRVAGVPARNM
ncbi:MAG: NeuD/PglB/VioB family sugar acetyltransferase [Alphaproteobacteria bacterium]|nr:NeuD/PglB/VioB family sugar acetyltransferase [Alphaproteobacteria bacterium]MBT7942768.1 NeuD/PglB/VioB family sugar acetyltransferase [Alphaproteobacteria bacterium]